MKGGVDGGEGDDAGALDVVVEEGDFGPVEIEDAAGVGETEIFLGKLLICTFL